jgi:hypothetical protein
MTTSTLSDRLKLSAADREIKASIIFVVFVDFLCFTSSILSYLPADRKDESRLKEKKKLRKPLRCSASNCFSVHKGRKKAPFFFRFTHKQALGRERNREKEGG